MLTNYKIVYLCYIYHSLLCFIFASRKRAFWLRYFLLISFSIGFVGGCDIFGGGGVIIVIIAIEIFRLRHHSVHIAYCRNIYHSKILVFHLLYTNIYTLCALNSIRFLLLALLLFLFLFWSIFCAFFRSVGRSRRNFNSAP